MPDFDRQNAVDRLRSFQRTVRDTIVRSRSTGGLSEVSRSSSADTIYKIDTEVEPILEQFCQEWGRDVPLVLIAEGMENEHGIEGPVTFPRGIPESKAVIRLIVDPIDGTRGIMYDKRAAWALAGVAPNNGPETSLRDIEVAVMTELPTSKMGFSDVLWAIRGRGAHGVREKIEPKTTEVETTGADGSLRNRPLGRVLTKLGKVKDDHVVEALNKQKRHGGLVGQILVGMGYVQEQDIQIALAFQQGNEPDMAPEVMSYITGDHFPLRPSQADTINHGFATVSNFFPGTKKLASGLMEHIARNLVGPADVTKATVFDDQYISTGGQFYELIVGHDRFIADLRPAFYRMQDQPEGLCCHPYDCATLLIAEEAGVLITDENGNPLDGPLDTTTGITWIGYANPMLKKKIEPFVQEFLQNPT
jgi:fructose-1,6-bisphosphatase/inositol monophosphatase family enzyme